MPRGRKSKLVSGHDKLSAALGHLKQAVELLGSAIHKGQIETATPGKIQASSVKAAGKPLQGEPAYQVYEILAKAKRPVKPEVLAQKTKKSLGSIRLYLSKFSCFENVRGKGYKLR